MDQAKGIPHSAHIHASPFRSDRVTLVDILPGIVAGDPYSGSRRIGRFLGWRPNALLISSIFLADYIPQAGESYYKLALPGRAFVCRPDGRSSLREAGEDIQLVRSMGEALCSRAECLCSRDCCGLAT